MKIIGNISTAYEEWTLGEGRNCRELKSPGKAFLGSENQQG
jgi:hypothetical protein